MLQGLFHTLVKVLVASLIVGAILAHFGISIETLMKEAGLSADTVNQFVRKGIAWVLPNVMLGALFIVPAWFVVFLFRPPRGSSGD